MVLSRMHWGVIFTLIASVLFASKAIFVKQAYALSPDVTAMSLLALRMLFALPFYLLIIFLSKNTQKISIKEWILLCFTGLMGYYASSVLDFLGLVYISASLERIILFLYPTITVIASAIIYKQKIPLFMWFAIGLSYGGTLLVMLNEAGMQSSSQHLWLGVGLVFGSAITYAMYLMMGQQLVKKFGSMRFTALATSVAALGVLLHYALETPSAVQYLIDLPYQVHIYGAILGVFSTVLPTILLMMGVERLGASHASMLSAGGPIFTLILAVIVLGEYLNGWQWLGCILNILGVLLVSFKKNSD